MLMVVVVVLLVLLVPVVPHEVLAVLAVPVEMDILFILLFVVNTAYFNKKSLPELEGILIFLSLLKLMLLLLS